MIFGLANVALIVTSDSQDVRGVIVALELLGGWGFVGAGLYAWPRRPDNRIGAVMVAHRLHLDDRRRAGVGRCR